MRERRDGNVEPFFQVVPFRVVQVQHVEAVEPRALERLLDARTDAVGREIPHPSVVGGHHEVVVGVELSGTLGVRFEQAPDLGRHDVLVARFRRQERTEPALGQPQPVVRGGVEIADADIPRGLQDRPGFVVGERPEQVADVGGAVAEVRQVQFAHVPKAYSARLAACISMPLPGAVGAW